MSSTRPQRLYSIQKFPEKGFGMIATAKIPKGTRILSESPLFKVPRTGPKNEISRDVILKTIAALSAQQKKQFLSLHNSYSDTDGQLLGRVRTNGLPLGVDGLAGGIFLEASRINHSCDPNANASWNDNLEQLTIHAAKDIAEGEEVTIYYLSHRANRTLRHTVLQEEMRIFCACSLCSLPIAERKKSDERLNAIQRLKDSLVNAPRVVVNPLDVLHDVQRLLSLLASEGVADFSTPKAYHYAFQIAISQADVARAKVFAERAAGARVILEGSDSPVVQKWQDLAENVTQLTELHQSGQWKTGIQDTPNGLGEDEFERWLWRKHIARLVEYANLRSMAAFPAFDGLPEETDVPLEFYTSQDGYSWNPRRHWCFLAEITHIADYERLILSVRDKNHRKVPVAFHTQGHGLELGLSTVQKGFTVAVLYGERHSFENGTKGIKHDTPAALKAQSTIFPTQLDDLLALSDRVQEYAKVSEGIRTCHGCDKKAASLNACARCEMFWYCNKACQVAGWNEKGHKADCKLLKDSDLKAMFLLDWAVYTAYIQFPLHLIKGTQ